MHINLFKRKAGATDMAQSRNRLLIPALCIFLFAVTAAVGYMTLKILNGDTSDESSVAAGNEDEDHQASSVLAEKADQSKSAGMTALSTGDYETATTRFNEAREFYEQTKNTSSAEEMKDMAAAAKQEAAIRNHKNDEEPHVFIVQPSQP